MRSAHDPELQKAMDKALGSSHPEFWSGVQKKESGVVVADVTDPHNPKVAWYNPNLMFYAASLPKIAIVLGVFVEIYPGVIKLDSDTILETGEINATFESQQYNRVEPWGVPGDYTL